MSNTRDGLLAQIIVALGGTVRNHNNRNMLLEDWRDAVGGGAPTERWYFSGNGVDQYINLANEISLSGDFEFKAYLERNTTSATAIFGGTNLSRCYEQVDGRIEIADSAGININGVLTDIANGELYYLELKRVSGTISAYVNGEFKGDGTYSDTVSITGIMRPQVITKLRTGRVYNVVIIDNGTEVLNMPLDDSFANNPTARNTVGDNATIINATGASWTLE